jgi:hypothetical protein
VNSSPKPNPNTLGEFIDAPEFVLFFHNNTEENILIAVNEKRF